VSHPVNQIADAIVELLLDETEAEDRVYRDREPDLEAREELPAIVIHIGDDEPTDSRPQSMWQSEVRIFVDLFVTARENEVSRDALALRSATYRILMADQHLGLPMVLRVLPDRVEQLERGEGSVPIGYLRTSFLVMYRHSLTDPDQ
jgi:hypothetical protein